MAWPKVGKGERSLPSPRQSAANRESSSTPAHKSSTPRSNGESPKAAASVSSAEGVGQRVGRLVQRPLVVLGRGHRRRPLAAAGVRITNRSPHRIADAAQRRQQVPPVGLDPVVVRHGRHLLSVTIEPARGEAVGCQWTFLRSCSPPSIVSTPSFEGRIERIFVCGQAAGILATRKPAPPAATLADHTAPRAASFSDNFWIMAFCSLIASTSKAVTC